MTVKDKSRRMFLKTAAMGGVALISLSCTKKGNKTVIDAFLKRELLLLSTKNKTLPIVQWNLKGSNRGSVLRLKAKLARSVDHRKIVRLDHLMRKTLEKSGGVGLAAPQVGISRRLVLVKLQGEDKRVITCLDPVMVKKSNEMIDGYEGCLSVAGVGGKVSRSTWVELTYRTLSGKLTTYKSIGWEARIFQHELDHLEGVLYIDKVVGKLLPYEEIKKIKEREKRLKKETSEKTANFSEPIPYALM